MLLKSPPVFSPILALTLAFLFINQVTIVQACTIFNKAQGGQVLFGNVENEAPQYTAELHFIPPEPAQGNFGHFYIFYNGNIAGGMNEKGLCFDVAGLPEHLASNGKPCADLMGYLLNKCETVGDALEFFNNYCWAGHALNHIMIMDNTGYSVVVEMIGSTVYVFNKSNPAHVMTNFSFADTSLHYGEYPCPRFEKATSMLDTAAITVDNFQKICEQVARAYYNALYTSVYNPLTLDIHFFNANIPNSARTSFNLAEELVLGQHHYLLKNNQVILGVTEINPEGFSVSESGPNPFQDQTHFSLELASSADVIIRVLDLNGTVVAILEDEYLAPGKYTYTWDAFKRPAGLYLCAIQVNAFRTTRKWVMKK